MNEIACFLIYRKMNTIIINYSSKLVSIRENDSFQSSFVRTFCPFYGMQNSREES